MTIRGLGVAAVFLVGCAVGGVSSQLVVPKASAQQAGMLPRWEYKCGVNLDAEEKDAFGAERWEMVGIAHSGTSIHACFKRPKM